MVCGQPDSPTPKPTAYAAPPRLPARRPGGRSGRARTCSGGVRMVSPLTAKMLQEDTSSRYVSVLASRYTTSLYPSFLAASCGCGVWCGVVWCGVCVCVWTGRGQGRRRAARGQRECAARDPEHGQQHDRAHAAQRATPAGGHGSPRTRAPPAQPPARPSPEPPAPPPPPPAAPG